jgi:hypothetical protein
MTDPDQSSLDILLVSATRAIPVPDPDSFASAVAGRLRSQLSDAATSRPVPERHRGRPLLVPALVALCAVIAALVPGVRSTLADLVGRGGTPSTRVASRPGPVAPQPASTTSPTSALTGTTLVSDPVAALGLGTPTTLLQAARLVGFPMRLPTIGGYQQPDAVLVVNPPAARTVSMVYLPAAGRLEVPGAKVAAVLSEFRGHLDSGSIEKLAGNGIAVQAVLIGGAPGFWVSGPLANFSYVTPNGTVATQTIHFVTNMLLWTFGRVTYLFETARPRDEAIAIARSMP